MARAIYLDLFAGVAGDMLLGTLVDLGAPLDELQARLATLPVAGWRFEVSAAEYGPLRGTRLHVALAPALPQPPRHLRDVVAVLGQADIPLDVQLGAVEVFRRLAEAEASVHGSTVDDVHFHEVGAVDALVDITGVLLGLHLLGIEAGSVYASGIPLGSGWVRSQHGRLPVPAPATVELLRRTNAPTRPDPGAAEGEISTPTGVALVTALAHFRQPPGMRLEKVGHGFGRKQFPWPNAVRAWIGTLEAAPLLRDSVVQVETNLDDLSPELLGFAMERLLEAGALDVSFQPLQMKKNRPGVLLRVLGRPEDGERLAALVLRHTSALGVRVQQVERRIARRSERTVATPWGAVRVKEKWLGEERFVAPEFEDCAALARAADVPLQRVYEAALRAADSSGLSG